MTVDANTIELTEGARRAWAVAARHRAAALRGAEIGDERCEVLADGTLRVWVPVCQRGVDFDVLLVDLPPGEWRVRRRDMN